MLGNRTIIWIATQEDFGISATEPQVYIKWKSVDLNETTTTQRAEDTFGVRWNFSEVYTIWKYLEDWSMETYLRLASSPFILFSAFWLSSTVDNGDTTYTHTFEASDNETLKPITIFVDEDWTTYKYTDVVVSQLELSWEADGEVNMTASFIWWEKKDLDGWDSIWTKTFLTWSEDMIVKSKNLWFYIANEQGESETEEILSSFSLTINNEVSAYRGFNSISPKSFDATDLDVSLSLTVRDWKWKINWKDLRDNETPRYLKITSTEANGDTLNLEFFKCYVEEVSESISRWEMKENEISLAVWYDEVNKRIIKSEITNWIASYDYDAWIIYS